MEEKKKTVTFKELEEGKQETLQNPKFAQFLITFIIIVHITDIATNLATLTAEVDAVTVELNTTDSESEKFRSAFVISLLLFAVIYC